MEIENPNQQKIVFRKHRLIIDDNNDDELAPIVFMHPDRMQELEIMENDNIMIKSRRGEICATVVGEDDMAENTIKMHRILRYNLKSKLGDVVGVREIDNVPYLSRVVVSALDDTIVGLEGDLVEPFVQPYFEAALSPIKLGMHFICMGAMRVLEFKIVEMKRIGANNEEEDCDVGLVVDHTIIQQTKEPISREDLQRPDDIGYDDVGGCRRQLGQIREMIELPLRHPQIFQKLGIKPPKGVLLYGPPGSGKTLIVKAIANETGVFVKIINGPEILSARAGESEATLRKIFEEAREKNGAIIFIDEIDAIAPNREKSGTETEKRIVSQLLVQMDGMDSRDNVIVIGATNRPNAIDPALRRFGRFDRELDIGVPDETGRLEILNIHTKKMKIGDDVDLLEIAKDTHGYVGADLAHLCTEAAMLCVREHVAHIDIEADNIPVDVLNEMKVTMAHFKSCMNKHAPAVLRETVIESPNIKWEDVGGLEDTKRELKELIQYPIEHADKFRKFGMEPSKGVLFFGPPGCGKTLLAKAVASQCKANFISVKGPEMLSMWVGESESNVRDVFAKARQAAPCVLFFDELDSIGKARGNSESEAGGAPDKILNQILTEMDGIGAKKQIFIIGATNQPLLLDKALIRPGRLDKMILIPVPDRESRISILQAHMRKSPISPDVDVNWLADNTVNYSGADLAEVVRRASRSAIRDHLNEIARLEDEKNIAIANGMEVEDKEPEIEVIIKVKHFEEALETTGPSITEQQIAQYQMYADELLNKGSIQDFHFD